MHPVRLRAAHRARMRPGHRLRRVPPHPFRRDGLRGLGRIDPFRKTRRRLQRRSQSGNDLPRQLPNEHSDVFLAQLRNDIIDAVTVDKHRTVGMDVADRPEDTQ